MAATVPLSLEDHEALASQIKCVQGEILKLWKMVNGKLYVKPSSKVLLSKANSLIERFKYDMMEVMSQNCSADETAAIYNQSRPD